MVKLSKSTLETIATFGASALALAAHDIYTQKTNKKIPSIFVVLPVTIAASYLSWKYIPKVDTTKQNHL